MKWKTEKRKINDLIPYEKNPRKMNEKQNKDLETSLKKFDLVEIPAINKDNTIIAGHQRLRIMQALGRGEDEIDVRVPDKQLNNRELQEYNIRSNKNLGEWDWEKLAESFETEDLVEWGFDEKDLTIDDKEIEGEIPFSEELLEEHNYIVLYFDNQIDWLNLQTIYPLPKVKALDAKDDYKRAGVGRVIKGTDFLDKIKR